MTTLRTMEDIHEKVLGDLLSPEKFWDILVDVIQQYCDPEDIFSEKELYNWAAGNELYSLSDIQSKMNPEDVFGESDLSDWARANGWKLDD